MTLGKFKTLEYVLTQVKKHPSVTSVENDFHDGVICRDISILTQVKHWSMVINVEQRSHVVLMYRDICILKEVGKT